jgi:hypothetical protein
VIGSIRSTSNSFTTRLALVFASWTDENIIRIETVQGAFVASSRRFFFFLTSKIFLNDRLKRLKRLEVLLGTFGESTGTDRFLICHEISPLCIKEHSRGKRHRKYFRTRPNEAPRPGCVLLPRRRRGPDALRGRTDICEESSRPNEN